MQTRTCSWQLANDKSDQIDSRRRAERTLGLVCLMRLVADMAMAADEWLMPQRMVPVWWRSVP